MRFIAVTVAAVGMACAIGGVAQAALPGADARLTRAPYLSDLTATSVQVSWATTTQSRGIVRYGQAGDCTANTVTAATTGVPITVNGVREYNTSVAVTGLSAGQTYCYRVYTGDASPVDLLGPVASPRFATLAPATGTAPLTFAVMGDWGDTTNRGVNNGELNVNQANLDAQIAASGASFLLTPGDVGNPNGNQTNYGDLNQTGVDVSSVFGPSYWAVPGQSIPVYGTNGNHGRNTTLLSVWPQSASAASSGGVYGMVSYPSIDGSTPSSYPTSYYAFSTGGARFYMLDASWSDTNVGTANGAACGSHCAIYQVDRDAHWAAASAQYQWLQQDLATHPGGMKFAVFHFPLRSDNATEPSDEYLQNKPGSTGTLEQLLHDNGVRFAFNGHSHDYQRNIAPPGGVMSYVTGGGGSKVSTVGGHGCATTDAYAVGWSYSGRIGSACGGAARPTSDAQVYHFLKVTVSGSQVTVTPTDSTGQTFDVQSYDFGQDSVAPSAPPALTATVGSQTRVALTWSASTDNVGVSAYDVYRDGTYLASTTADVRSYADTITAGSGHQYQVHARDLAGNTQAATVVVNGGSGDTIPPTPPTGLAVTATGPASASLSWSAATDNVGVASYAVLRGGVLVASVPGDTTSYQDTGLAPGTSYTYQVLAYDAAGNSSASGQVTGTTGTVDSSIFSDGFESGNLAQWTTVSGLSTQGSLVHGGAFAARETSTGTATYAYKTLPSAYSELWAQAWVQVASRSTSANLFGFRTAGGGSIVNVYIDTNGRVSLRNNVGGVTTYGTTTVAAGGWHRVTLHARVAGGSSALDVSLDGVPVPGLALNGQNLGVDPIARLQLGETATGRVYDIALDDVTVSSASL